MIDKTKNTANVGTTLPPWLVKHREAVSKPLIDSFINAVRQVPGTGKVGAIGFCWGGRYAILAAHGEVDAAYACHPSLVAVPGDFEDVKKPLSLAVGDKDSLLDNNTVGQIQDLIAKKTELPHELRIYEGQVHGFSLRSDVCVYLPRIYVSVESRTPPFLIIIRKHILIAYSGHPKRIGRPWMRLNSRELSGLTSISHKDSGLSRFVLIWWRKLKIKAVAWDDWQMRFNAQFHSRYLGVETEPRIAASLRESDVDLVPKCKTIFRRFNCWDVICGTPDHFEPEPVCMLA